MNIGFLGLGKLGLPTALAIEHKGHSVCGYDVSPDVRSYITNRKIPYKEIYAQEYLDKSDIRLVAIDELVKFSDIIFVPIQTPHLPKFEGITRLPDDRSDFDYSFLKKGISDLSHEIGKQKVDRTIIIISTVLPGTINREIKPLLNDHVKLCYNPFFIAMGTTIPDFLNPEIILFGTSDEAAANMLRTFYQTIHSKPFYRTTIENAELIKVLYNTFISTKISFANTIMEICHKSPNTNADEIIGALKLCTDRIISPKYMSGGMGDGGACHVRDNIALSWLSNKLNLSFNWFDMIVKQREKHTEWLADLIESKHKETKFPIVLLGKSFKPETKITVGSPSILLANILKERGQHFKHFDPYIDTASLTLIEPHIFFIGTNHDVFAGWKYPPGSIVLDPWRYISQAEGYKVIPIGINNNT